MTSAISSAIENDNLYIKNNALSEIIIHLNNDESRLNSEGIPFDF